MSTALARLFVALTLAASLGACKQGLGDHCQIEDDCEEALTCVLPGNNPRVGGTCQMVTTNVTQDMAVPPVIDMAQPVPDMAMAAPDLTVTDGASSD